MIKIFLRTCTMNSTLGSIVPLAMFISCHFYTLRGWIANELFRRVHPDGKTIGGFIRENISKPLGERAQHTDFIIFLYLYLIVKVLVSLSASKMPKLKITSLGERLVLVDCPTQLICAWIFICSMTKLKEHSREIC